MLGNHVPKWVIALGLLCSAACSDDKPGQAPPATPSGQSTSGTTASGAAGSGAAGAGRGAPASAGTAASTGRAGTSGASPPGASGSAAPAAGSGGTGPSSPAGTGATPAADGFYRMELLKRGLVAVQVPDGVFLSWRVFGYEYDAQDESKLAYEVYRDGTLIATVTSGSNYRDTSGSASAAYSVKPVIAGAAGEASEPVMPAAESFRRIPIEPPPSGSTPGSPTCETANENYSYAANDGSVGDLDGDGEYELVLKWDPSNSKDNSQSGCTGPVFLDAYELDGKRLWRLDLGPNIRAGAHYTQFVVIDLDGDGKAEVTLKTAPGTKDGSGAFLKLGPAADDDDAADFRSQKNASGRTGYVLSGPEYLSVFSGETGAELATVEFDQARGSVNAWGDDYGNRVDRFLAGAAWLDESGLPSAVMGRGYYTRSTLSAWNFRDGKLSQLWKFDSDQTPTDSKNKPFSGQGTHSLTIANVDDDRGQEIIYGAMMVENDGKGGCSTGFGHGDALHVSDFVPSRPGLEVFMPHEDGKHPAYDLRDAASCEILFMGPINGEDTGRGVIADLTPDHPGAEMWASGSGGLLGAPDGARVGDNPRSTNFLIWWDGDESRELEDGVGITKYGGGELVSCSSCAANNGTKSTPVLVADLLGDWREEVIWRESDNRALRLYTTTEPSERRIFTLMHDPQYRAQIASQQTAYNQPSHPSFHIGGGMTAPPRPDIRVR